MNSTMKALGPYQLKPGTKVHCFGNVGEVVSVYGNLAKVLFTGKTTDGRFGEMKGGCTVLIQNLTAMK